MKHTWLFMLAVVSISSGELACGSSDASSGGSAGSAGSAAGGAAGSAGNGAGSGGKAGGSSNDGFPAAIALDADIRMLASADKALLCDWVNGKLGGYNVSSPCGNGTVASDKDQAQCLVTRFRYQCKVTPADLRECTLAEAPDHACTTAFPACQRLACQ